MSPLKFYLVDLSLSGSNPTSRYTDACHKKVEEVWALVVLVSHVCVEFVGTLICTERFFPEYSGFPHFSKTNI